jgi:LmbE family N-acetylglucosaminyl deacetylase
LFDLPDNRFDTVPLLDIVKLIEGLIEQIKPSVVYTQHGGDLNVDHRALYEATLAATRPLPGSCVRSVLSYEVASSTEWAFGQFAPAFHPNVFVEISDTLPAKIAAMQAYESEARAFPHPRAPESLEAMARRWGSTVGVAAAEAFAPGGANAGRTSAKRRLNGRTPAFRRGLWWLICGNVIARLR